MSPGPVTISCEIEDVGPKPPTGDTGSRKDEILKREVTLQVLSVQLQSRRMQALEESSPKAWSSEDATTIAAGGADSPEQKAQLRLVHGNELVTFPVGNISLNEDEAKGEEGPNGVLTMEGAEGEYKSSNVMNVLVHVRLAAGPGSLEASINQVWGETYQWNVPQEFEYGKQYPLAFTPFLEGNVKIKNQQVSFKPSTITFYSWSSEESDFVPYTFTPTSTTPEKWERVSSNVQITESTATGPSGVYTAQFTINYDKQRMIDQVEFSATGENIYKP